VNLGSLADFELRVALRGTGLCLRTGDFVFRLRSPLPEIRETLRLLYADYPLEPEGGFADFDVQVTPPRGPRRWVRPQVLFLLDGRPWFKPLPRRHAVPMLEWGMNWCVYHHMHCYLVIHAAVAARGGRAVLMPGPPGAGKSTLCAALAARGWRLLSDEMALVDPKDGQVHPLPRPISLKNESIEVMRRFAPDAVVSPEAVATEKGTIAYLKPPAQALARAQEPARPAWVIFPKYEAGAGARVEPVSKGRAFMRLAQGAFNYSVLGAEGFRVLGDLVEACACHALDYDDLDAALRRFEGLAAPARPGRVSAIS